MAPKSIEERARTELNTALLKTETMQLLEDDYEIVAQIASKDKIKKDKNLAFPILCFAWKYKDLRQKKSWNRSAVVDYMIKNISQHMQQTLRKKYIDQTPKRIRNENKQQVYEKSLEINRKNINIIESIFKESDFKQRQSVQKSVQLFYKKTKNDLLKKSQKDSKNRIVDILLKYAYTSKDDIEVHEKKELEIKNLGLGQTNDSNHKNINEDELESLVSNLEFYRNWSRKEQEMQLLEEQEIKSSFSKNSNFGFFGY